MSRKPIRLGILALTLSASAGAAPQTSAPLPADPFVQNSASPQNNAPAQSNASSQTKGAPTPAQLDQPGAVVMPPPILRNAGTTYVTPDQPLLGRLSPQGQRLPGTLGEQPPPAMQPAPNQAALIRGTGDLGEVIQ
jgi:glucose/arabinose dehydrogenase